MAKRDIIGIVFVGASKSGDQKTDEEKTVSQQRGGDAKIKSPAVRRPQDDDGNLGDEQRRKADLGKCKQKTVCAALKFAEKRDDNAQHSADQRRDGDDTDAVADAQKEINHHTRAPPRQKEFGRCGQIR